MMELLNDGTNVVRRDRPRGTSPAKPNKNEGAFNPSKNNMDEVKDFVTANPDQIDAVLQAEEAGEGRKTLIEWLESQKDDSGLS